MHGAEERGVGVGELRGSCPDSGFIWGWGGSVHSSGLRLSWAGGPGKGLLGGRTSGRRPGRLPGSPTPGWVGPGCSGSRMEAGSEGRGQPRPCWEEGGLWSPGGGYPQLWQMPSTAALGPGGWRSEALGPELVGPEEGCPPAPGGSRGEAGAERWQCERTGAQRLHSEHGQGLPPSLLPCLPFLGGEPGDNAFLPRLRHTQVPSRPGALPLSRFQQFLSRCFWKCWAPCPPPTERSTPSTVSGGGGRRGRTRTRQVAAPARNPARVPPLGRCYRN